MKKILLFTFLFLCTLPVSSKKAGELLFCNGISGRKEHLCQVAMKQSLMKSFV